MEEASPFQTYSIYRGMYKFDHLCENIVPLQSFSNCLVTFCQACGALIFCAFKVCLNLPMQPHALLAHLEAVLHQNMSELKPVYIMLSSGFPD